MNTHLYCIQCNLAYRGILQFFAPYKPTWHIGESYTFANGERGIGFRFQYPKFPDMPSWDFFQMFSDYVIALPFSLADTTSSCGIIRGLAVLFAVAYEPQTVAIWTCLPSSSCLLSVCTDMSSFWTI